MNLDRELLRQYYLKNGYADVQVTAANAELDRDGSGFFITYAIDEGEPYNFGAINVESTVANVDPAAYRRRISTDEGDTYNAIEHRQVGRGPDARGLARRATPSPACGRKAEADPVAAQDQPHLRDRGRAAGLHRAHQHHRQHAHQGLRHPPRVPAGGRRCLQSAHGRSGQEAPEEPRPVQERRDQSPPGLGARIASSSTSRWSSSRPASCRSAPATRPRKA